MYNNYLSNLHIYICTYIYIYIHIIYDIVIRILQYPMHFFTKHLNVWSFQLLAAWRFRPQPLSLSPFAWAVGSCRPAARSQPGWSSQNLSGTNQWGFNDKDQGFNCPMIKHWKIRKFNDPSSNINDKDQCYDSHINCPANTMWETYNDCANISWIRQPKTRMMKVGAMGPGQSIYTVYSTKRKDHSIQNKIYGFGCTNQAIGYCTQQTGQKLGCKQKSLWL
jgi:hypothetical protein